MAARRSAADTAFFYGTLMHPDILRRVIEHKGASLKICQAVLLNYTRHPVKFAQYPGMLPYCKSRQMFTRDLDPEEKLVQGTLVSGLTIGDIALLDEFEGDEYVREVVGVHHLGDFMDLAESPVVHELSSTSSSLPLPPTSELPPPLIQAQTYVYNEPIALLEAELWSYDKFVKYDAWQWI